MIEGGFAVAGALVAAVVGIKVHVKGGSFVVAAGGVAVCWAVVGFVLGVWR